MAGAALLVEEQRPAGVDLTERHAACQLVAVQRSVRNADGILHPEAECRHRIYRLGRPDRIDVDLPAACILLDERVDDARREVDVVIVADHEAVIAVEEAVSRGRIPARLRRRHVARAGNVADIRLEILHFIEDSRIVEELLLGTVPRVEASREIYGLARSGIELPDHAISPAVEMAAGAILPAVRGEPIFRRDIRPGRPPEVAARGEEHFRPDQHPLGQRTGRWPRRGLNDFDDGVGDEVDDGYVAGDEIRRVSARAGSVDCDTQWVLAGINATGRRIVRIIEIDVGGRTSLSPVKLKMPFALTLSSTRRSLPEDTT
jgi:hypothetical protein